MHNNTAIVRLLLGDRSGVDEQLTDTEIEILLEESGNDAYWAAWLGATILSAVNITAATASVDGVSVSSGDISAKYQNLAGVLQGIAAQRSGFAPFAGGVDTSYKETVKYDTSRVRGYFTREMHRALGRVINESVTTE